MINLEILPIDITFHIQKFRKYLNNAWPSFMKIIDDHDWDEDETDPFNTWIQASWEILVERVLLGTKLNMMSLSGGWKDSKILPANRKPDFVVLGQVKGIEIDLKYDNIIPKNRPLRIFAFSTYVPIYNSFSRGDPFEIICLIDDKKRKAFYVPENYVKFYLYPISILEQGIIT